VRFEFFSSWAAFSPRRRRVGDFINAKANKGEGRQPKATEAWWNNPPPRTEQEGIIVCAQKNMVPQLMTDELPSPRNSRPASARG